MKKIKPVLILILLMSSAAQAQEYQEILRNIFHDGEYWFAEESYPDALTEYQKLYTRGYEDNANINYRMGVCYLNMPGEKDKAIPYLEKAVQNVTPRYKEGIFKESKAPYDSWLYLGNAYRINNQLDKAAGAYAKYKELIENEESEEIMYADKQIEAVSSTMESMENPVYHIKEHTGELINTARSDFNPVVSWDESVMVYMTAMPFYDAIKISRKENGEWTEPRQITAEMEPEARLYVNSISRDGNRLFLNQEDNFNSDIYVSNYEDDRWSKAQPLNKEINTKYWESHACISADGESLYIASNRKDGQGGMDIWVSTLGPEGWQEPQNLGPTINTELNEDHPFISEDGDVLFFSSQGHFNLGGYDVFYTKKLSDGNWSEPKNIGYPINTTDDDLFFVPIGTGKSAYQALFAEEDNLGSRDIYRLQMFETEAEYLAAITPPPEPEEPVEEPVVEPVEEPAEEPVVEPAEEVIPAEEPEPEPAVTYVIRPVFFGFDRSDLTAEAKSTLDDVVEILKVFPALELNAVGHTDHIGSVNYNMMLSKKRSASVVSYFTRKGIEGTRIKALGKGEGQPVARNSNPDGSDSPGGRKLNRRVEIQIVKPELPNVEIEGVKVPDNLKK